MKIQTRNIIQLMTVLVTIIALGISPVFAQSTTSVSIPPGSSVPGCEETNECYIPSEITVDVDSEITWTNDDSAAHTVTSGTPADGPDGVFDSSLFMAGAEFSHKFEETGTFNYFCMVHPWMEGIVTVKEAGAQPMPTAPIELDQIMAEIQTSDGIANNPMKIDLTLTDLDGTSIEHITYNIKATQGSNVVLNEEGHMHKGTMTNSHTTNALPVAASDSMPVSITITSVGFGHDDQYVDVPGEIATKQVVPEFGAIAAMILTIAIISIIAVSSKPNLRIIPRF